MNAIKYLVCFSALVFTLQIGISQSVPNKLTNSHRDCLNFVNVSHKTGIKIDGNVTSWQTKNGPFNVEHLAGKSTDGDLIVFYWSPQNDWQTVNVSHKTDIKIDGNVTSWQTKNGPINVEHLAVKSTDGDLIVFYWSPQNDWQAVNVSNKTGIKIDGDVTSWQTKNGALNVEHLAGKSTDGDLIVFYWSPQNDWQTVNVSQKTRIKIDGNVTSWQTKNGALNVEHLAGKSTDGDLIVFYWSPQNDWQVVNVSQKTGIKIDGNVTSWQTRNGVLNVEHLAGKSIYNDLVVFYWSPQTDWQAVNVSEKTGRKIRGVNSVYQRRIHGHNEEILVSRGLNNDLLLQWWSPQYDWQLINFTNVSNFKSFNLPTSWLTGEDNSIVEHTAFQRTDNSLIVIWSYERYRVHKEIILEPYYGIEKEVRNKKIVTILLDPKRPEHIALPKSEVEDMLFGSSNSVLDYYLENSNGKFTIQNEGILGWYTTDEAPEYYWEGEPDACTDGWNNTHHRRYKEAILKASEDFDFSKYDLNNDGFLHPNELGILICIPQEVSYGVVRTAVSQQCPDMIPLEVQGVRFGSIVEVFLGNPPHIGITVHELCHLLHSLGDMYPNDCAGFQEQYSAGAYSIMAKHYVNQHLDPYAKLKFGWLKSEIVYNSGIYNLRDIENHHEVLILFDPERAQKEFFIIENRWRGDSYDKDLNDQGIAVWHITEDPSLSNGCWSRSAIKLLRSYIGTNFPSDNRALFDGSQPSTGYDLISNDPNPNHPSLKWRDGTESGFAIRNFPAASNNMSFYIETPWDCNYPSFRDNGPSIELDTSYPSVISTTARFPLIIRRESHVAIDLLDEKGIKISSIFDGKLSEGKHYINWSKGYLPTGMYFYTVRTKDISVTKKLEILE